jgi:hypothetical protein
MDHEAEVETGSKTPKKTTKKKNSIAGTVMKTVLVEGAKAAVMAI